MQHRMREFTWTGHPTLDPGWKPSKAGPGWYPGAGFLTAHDVVEHLSDKSDWAHELRATGVSVFDVRGVKHRDVESIVGDILSFAAHDHDMDAPKAPPLAHKPLEPVHEKRVQSFITHLRLALDKGVAKAEAAGAPIPASARANIPSFPDKVEPWVRLGYRAALRVYGDRGREVGEMMDRIRDEVNKDHDKLRPVKGDRIVIDVDTKALTFTYRREGPTLTPQQRKDRWVKERIDEMFGGLFAQPII